MIQGKPPTHRYLVARSLLLQRHPVLAPVVLLGSSLLLGSMSIFSGMLFPILALIGISVSTLVLLCLLLASILGIAGILASIIGILEYADRRCSMPTVSVPTFLRLKEQTYANRH